MIRLHNVTKVYDNSIVALKEVGLEVAKGEFVFLVGPSGSGKSTLLRLMMREETPDSGDVWVAGKHASSLPSWKVPHLRRSIGTVFQDFKLLPNKTVYENVSFALEVTGRSRHVLRNQVPQVLKLVGLSDKADRQPRQLSGGEQQRVSIARAFVNRPLILLADEPTGNLDPATSVGIMRILDRINRTGTTVVMATHDHAIVDAMRRRVVQLEAGLVIRDQRSGAYEIRMQSGAPQPLPPSPAAAVRPPGAAEPSAEEIAEEALQVAMAEAAAAEAKAAAAEAKAAAAEAAVLEAAVIEASIAEQAAPDADETSPEAETTGAVTADEATPTPDETADTSTETDA